MSERLRIGIIGAGHGGWKNHFGTWFTDRTRSGGGAFLTCGVYLIDILHWYGFPISAINTAMKRQFLDGDCEDDAVALVKLPMALWVLCMLRMPGRTPIRNNCA